MMYENTINAADQIQSEAGEYQFCRFCELEDTCQKTGLPKILQINLKIYRYAKLMSDNRCEYPYPGSWEHQPAYFISLLEKAKGEILIQQRANKGGENAGEQ